MSRRLCFTTLSSVTTIALLTIPPLAQGAVSPEASFQAQIQPIIFKSCNGCHTYGGHAGGLRLDTYADFMKGGDSGPLVVAGDPKASLIVQLVSRGHTLKKGTGRPFPESDLTILTNWIRDPTAMSGTASNSLVAATPASAPTPAPAPASAAATPVAQPDVKITPEQELFFENKVRPLLTKNCYACHTTTAMSDLRLDSREAILKGGKRGPAAIAGDPASSLIISAVRYNSTPRMPPPGPLKSEEVAVLEQWVREGLPWPQPVISKSILKITEEQRNFWSFRPPVKPAAPNTDSRWAYNDIDKFIAAKHQEKGLKPVADAEKRILLRRVSFDHSIHLRRRIKELQINGSQTA